MTRLTLRASVHPDVIIVDGWTYVVLPLPDGLTIYGNVNGWGDPLRVFPVGDWPRFFHHNSGVLVAYRTDHDDCLTVANVTTGEITMTGIPALWNSPICWRDDGLLCVQAVNDPIGVWSGFWPALPSAPVIRQGVGTGLAQWWNLNLYSWDEWNANVGVTNGSQAVFLGSETVGQGPQGGILVWMGNKTGTLAPFTSTNDPRPALASDGSLSVVYWIQGPHGSEGTVLLQGVTAADLIVDPIRPVSDVVPLPSVSVAASFVFPR